MSQEIVLYGLSASPYVIPIKALCNQNDIPFVDKETNILDDSAPNKTPEYKKMNPMHSVPTIDDNGFYMWESKAVMAYVSNKYGLVDWYPEDPVKFANCHSAFELQNRFHGVVFSNYVYHLAGLPGGKEPDHASKKTADELLVGTLIPAFKSLRGEHHFLGGAKPNLADLAFLGTLVTVFPSVASNFKSPKTEMEKVTVPNLKAEVKTLEDYYKAIKTVLSNKPKNLTLLNSVEEMWKSMFKKPT